MKPDRLRLATLIPLFSLMVVACIAFGLGGIFIALYKTPLGEWGSVIVGMALVIGVPAVAALAERMLEGGM